jgi:NitT/TauT family transport system substrate-binding protein
MRYVEAPADANSAAVTGHQVDFALDFPVLFLPGIEAGAPITVLAGVHAGCIELFVKDNIHGIAELTGKTVGLEACPPNVLRLIAAQVGLDLDKHIRWVGGPGGNALEQFAQGKLDAFLGFAPEPQELRARNAGKVILSTAADRPWSQYFCCMLFGNRDWIRNYPVATKRMLRAILKSTDLCVADPMGVARRLVDRRLAPRYDYAPQTLNDISYNNWREYDAEDTLRFYALRMRDAGFVESTPQKIIADGTDWRFLDEVKRELKA